MLNIKSNIIQQKSIPSRLKNDEKASTVLLSNNNPTSGLNNFEVGQSIKSSLLLSFKGTSLKDLKRGGDADEVEIPENEELSWGDDTEVVSAPSTKRSKAKNNDEDYELAKEEKTELKKQKARNEYLDRQVAREKRQGFIDALKVSLLGTILTAGGIFASPYVPAIQKKASQISDTVEMVSNPQCVAPSISSWKLLKPTPPEFLKAENDTTPDPYHLKTTEKCLAPEVIEQLQQKKLLIKSKDQYLKLSENELNTFNQMKAHSTSYMEIDAKGNQESYISFLPAEAKMSDGRVIPKGTIFFQTFIDRGVNNSKRVELMAYIDPDTGFINNVEKDLTKNMPVEFKPNDLNGLQEINNAAQQINERIKNLVGKYNAKDNPEASDTIISDPLNSIFFNVKTYDLAILNQTILKNKKTTIVFNNEDKTVNMVFARSPEKDTSMSAKIKKMITPSNPWEEVFSKFTDNIKYSFVFFEKGTILPENTDFKNASECEAFGDKIKSFIFVTDKGEIGILSKDGLYIPPLNTLQFKKDTIAELISVKEQIHSMRQDLFKDNGLEQFKEIAEGSNNAKAITSLNYEVAPNALHPNIVTALHATFIGNSNISLKGSNNKDILSLEKHRDFDTKALSYTFKVDPLGNKSYTGTIDENGVITFNTPGATQFETDALKRRVITIIESSKTNSPNVLATKTPRGRAK